MSMPYSIETRPDTGLYNGKLGMWLFLASEIMFFGALFSSYAFLRTAAAEWPDGSAVLPVAPALIAAAACVIAAVASARAWSAGRQGGDTTRWLWPIAIAGVIAPAAMLFGLRLETLEGMAPATNTFYACWFLIAGLAGLHALAGGAVAFLYLWQAQTAKAGPARQNQLECLGIYWQFVTLVWFVTFACFYLF